MYSKFWLLPIEIMTDGLIGNFIKLQILSCKSNAQCFYKQLGLGNIPLGCSFFKIIKIEIWLTVAQELCLINNNGVILHVDHLKPERINSISIRFTVDNNWWFTLLTKNKKYFILYSKYTFSSTFSQLLRVILKSGLLINWLFVEQPFTASIENNWKSSDIYQKQNTLMIGTFH